MIRRCRVLTVEALEPRLAPSTVPLVVTEIMYDPADPTAEEIAAGYTKSAAFEFLELQNIGGQDLSLAGFSLSDAIDFAFPAMILAPDEYIVVVNDPGAFATRYGAGIRIAGEYKGGLPNAPAQMILRDAAGQILLDFVYDDRWYSETNGEGSSLAIVDPNATASTWSDPESWLPSPEMGGSPGRANFSLDATPPSVPQNLRATDIDGGGVSLLWDAAEDPETGVAGYRLYRDGARVGSSTVPLLTDASVRPAATYEYRVSAVNGDGMESAVGGTLTVCVPPVGTEPAFAPAVPQGTVADDRITEASGLAASRRNGDVLWTHSDGGTATLHAINGRGDYLGAFSLNGIPAIDCEDIAAGPGPVAGVDYLYLGDIGDNDSIRPSIAVYRVAEPTVDANGGDQSQTIAAVEAFALYYPDGAHDAETLLCDPWTGDLYVVTKELSPNRVYRAAAADLIAGHAAILTFVGTVDFPLANGGDISPNGREILLRSEGAVRLYTRSLGQSVIAALTGAARAVPVVGTPDEPNGEAIAFDANGRGYFTLSEGRNQPLHYFHRTSVPIGSTRTWTGGAGGEWTAAANWLDGEAPQAGDTLVFPADAESMLNDFPAGAYFCALVFEGGSASVWGNPLSLPTGGSTTVTVAAGAECSLNVPIWGTGTLRVDGGGSLVAPTLGGPSGGASIHVQAGEIAAAAIVADTLTIGAGCSVVIAPTPPPSSAPSLSAAASTLVQPSTYSESISSQVSPLSATAPGVAPPTQTVVPLADSPTLAQLALLLAMEQSATELSARRHLQAIDALLIEGTPFVADSPGTFGLARPLGRKAADRWRARA